MMMKRYITTISIIFFITPLVAGASQLYLETVPATVNTGDTITATLFLDTQGDFINALEGSVSFSQNLSLVQMSHGDSLITFWVRSPEVSGDTISYAGIVPGGYRGEVSPKWVGYHPGKVFSVVFQAISAGNAWVQVNRESTVLLNDGKATEAPLTVKDTVFVVNNGKEGKTFTPATPSWNDTTPPEPFTPFVIRNPDTFFSGKYYLIFETSDKDSGVAYYEVQEGDGVFERAVSPYLLVNQRRDKPITVRAVDRAGNVQNAVVPPVLPQLWYESAITYNVLVFSILACIIVGIIKRKRSHARNEEYDT